MSKLNDEILWNTYSNVHQQELIDLSVNFDLIINSFHIENDELIINDRLHDNWREIYYQVWKLNVNSVFEVGCGSGQHLINLRRMNDKIILTGCDISFNQLLIGCRFFDLHKYDFASNLSVENFAALNPDSLLMMPCEFVFSQAVVMHLSTINAAIFLNNLKLKSSKYILLLDSKANHSNYKELIDFSFPKTEYVRHEPKYSDGLIFERI